MRVTTTRWFSAAQTKLSEHNCPRQRKPIYVFPCLSFPLCDPTQLRGDQEWG